MVDLFFINCFNVKIKRIGLSFHYQKGDTRESIPKNFKVKTQLKEWRAYKLRFFILMLLCIL